MASYESLSNAYDELTRDVDYSRWADYIQWHFSRLRHPVHTVLDLACGTGSLSLELSRRGYRLTGVDRSGDMLALAEEKCRRAGFAVPFFCEDMARLRLPERVDACVCCLDSVNYVVQPDKLRRAFRRVYDILEPGGLFLFDADTPDKLLAMDGQVFLDETQQVFCVWRGEFSPGRRVCSFWMDLFEKNGAVWSRSGELHEEYAYTPQELTDFLLQAGFAAPKLYGELKRRAPRAGEQRIFFAAVKGEGANHGR